MPAGQGEDAERFAAALEQGTPPGFADDGEFARELAIVAMLRSAGSEFAPDPNAKARAKQRLMAIVAEQGEQRRGTVPRPVPPPTAQEMTAPIERVRESFPTPRAEQGHPVDGRTARNAATETEKLAPVRTGDAAEAEEASASGPRTLSPSLPVRRGGRRSRHSLASRPAGRDSGPRRPEPRLRRRFALVTAAALVAMIALTGGGLVASREALPGDTLYGLKRAAESAELALTFDEAARAQRYLDIAATRLSEVEQLVQRGGQQVNPDVYTAAIKEFDSSTGQGSRLLLTAAEGDRSAADLDTLTSWAARQSNRLTELLPSLPAPAAADADGSLQLLDLLLGRAEALGASPGAPSRLDDEGSGGSGPDGTDSPRSGSSTEAEDGTPPPQTGGEEPSDAPSNTPENDGGLIGDVGDLIDGDSQPTEGDSPEEGESEGEGVSSSEPGAPPSGEGGDGVNVPLPLLPPITLPSLLPGMPPITIG